MAQQVTEHYGYQYWTNGLGDSGYGIVDLASGYQIMSVQTEEHAEKGCKVYEERHAEVQAKLADKITEHRQRQTERKARRAAAQQALRTAPATQRQIDYADSLIAKAMRWGAQGLPTREELAGMTKAGISQLIDQLHEQY